MGNDPPNPSDSYSQVDYRRLIGWSSRLERERPFLLETLPTEAGSRILDLGCGTGEHSRFLVEEGFEVLGIDSSPSMLHKARDQPLPSRLKFLEADLRQLTGRIEAPWHGALCLGNVLPHLASPEALSRMFTGLRSLLLPGSPLVIQLLNYDRIIDRGLRSLPIRIQPGPEDEEIVFLRLMTVREDGSVIFNPITLRYRPQEEEPLEVIASRRVDIRGWRRSEVLDHLRDCGFVQHEVFGGMNREPWVADESSDLVVVAR